MLERIERLDGDASATSGRTRSSSARDGDLGSKLDRAGLLLHDDVRCLAYRPSMSHHWTPMSMVFRSIRSSEWRMGDREEELGWIRLVWYQSLPTYVCVTRDGWVVGGGNTLSDAARAFFLWRTQQKSNQARVAY